MKRALAFAVAATAALAFGTGPAFAGNGFAMAVDVRNSHETIVGSSNGSCTWQVSSDVTLVNLTSQSLTVQDVTYSVSWTGPNGASAVQNDITVLDSGGLGPGVVLAPHEQRTFSPVVVEFVIPCSADYGDLSVRVTTAQGTSSGDAPFLENGTPVSVAAAGVLGLGSIVGGVLLVVQRRRRRPAPISA